MILRITLLHGLGFTRPPLWLQPLIPNSTCWSLGVKSHVQSTWHGKILVPLVSTSALFDQRSAKAHLGALCRGFWNAAESVERREFRKDGRGDLGFRDPEGTRELF